MRLRQIAIVVADLEPAVGLFEDVFGLHVCHRDPVVAKWGLANALLPLGHDFVEVLAPTRPDTTATRYLARRGGDGGYMVILQCADGLALRRRLSGAGVRVVHTADRGPYHCTQYHPADVGGTLLEVDSMDGVADHLAPEAAWAPAGNAWLPRVDTRVAHRIAGVAIQSADPAAMAETWSRVLDRPLRADGAGAQHLTLDDGAQIRFVPAADGRGDGFSELDVVADVDAVLAAARARGLPVAGRQVSLCGLRVNLRPGQA
ncbi:MAG: VOC family protein [Hyphomicrobiales bacterium]|nr:VOC family protein [Hyphomicrobiales bacterium]